MNNLKYKFLRSKIDADELIPLHMFGSILISIVLFIAFIGINNGLNLGITCDSTLFCLFFILSVIIIYMFIVFYFIESSEWDWRIKCVKGCYKIQYKNVFGHWKSLNTWDLPYVFKKFFDKLNDNDSFYEVSVEKLHDILEKYKDYKTKEIQNKFKEQYKKKNTNFVIYNKTKETKE